MPRLFAVVLIVMVSTMCLSNDWTAAQESKQKCKECPVAKTANTHEFEFEFPGIDFPLGIRVAVGHQENVGNPSKVDGCIEIECECSHAAAIPFLSNLPVMGELFTNVKSSAHPSFFAAADTDSCNGHACSTPIEKGTSKPASPCTGEPEAFASCQDCQQNSLSCNASQKQCSSAQVLKCAPGGSSSCAACQQESKSEKCDCCPSVQNGVPIKGSNRLFTNISASNSCPVCEQKTKCQTCEGCPSACATNANQEKRPLGCQGTARGVQLVSYVAASDNAVNHPRIEAAETVIELRLQNERLKMEVEAAEIRLAMMEAMMEIREENAILRTQVEFLRAHHGHPATPTNPTPDTK